MTTLSPGCYTPGAGTDSCSLKTCPLRIFYTLISHHGQTPYPDRHHQTASHWPKHHVLLQRGASFFQPSIRPADILSSSSADHASKMSQPRLNHQDSALAWSGDFPYFWSGGLSPLDTKSLCPWGEIVTNLTRLCWYRPILFFIHQHFQYLDISTNHCIHTDLIPLLKCLITGSCWFMTNHFLSKQCWNTLPKTKFFFFFIISCNSQYFEMHFQLLHFRILSLWLYRINVFISCSSVHIQKSLSGRQERQTKSLWLEIKKCSKSCLNNIQEH